MTQYRIHDLERLTGVKAHTIRIWEKRYTLIVPSRTDTNRRYYNNAQLLRLMNVSTLLGHGFKISNLAVFTDEQLAHHIEQLHKNPSLDIACAAYIHDLSTAMVEFDEPHFEEIFNAAVKDLGFFEAMIKVFYPFLRKAGLLWRTDKVVAIQEHFASCVIRRKIIAAIDNLPIPKNATKKFLLFLPPNEWHEIGMLFANYVIRAKGLSTVYLGQNVPYDDLNMVVDKTRPDFLLTFFVCPKPTEEIKAELQHLVFKNPGMKILVSGDTAMLNSVQFADEQVKYLKNVEDLLSIL